MMLQFPLYVIALFSFFDVTKVQAMSGQEIASQWAIRDPVTGYDSGSNTFTMKYFGTSSGIDTSNFRVSFWDKHCKDPEKIADGSTPSQYDLDKGIDADPISIANYEITNGKQTYVFPTTEIKPRDNSRFGLVHGLCVLGATSATASSNDDGFTYTTTVPVFADGIKLWGDRDYSSVGVNGGGDALCEGGLYLQPSGHLGPETGTDITVEATPKDSSVGVTVCAFVEKPFTKNNVVYDRSGNWHNLLPKRGFTESSKTFGLSNHWNSYCKPLLPEATLSFKLDTEVLAKNDKIYTSPSADTNTDEGKMEFCTRMSVGYGDGEDFTEVNFVESVLTIKYDLEADFDLSEFNVAPKIKDTSTGSKEYAVEAALCPGSDTSFNQGSLICVEVKPNDDSADDGIVMRSIDSFDWTRDNIVQPAITDSNAISDNQLTSITCDANSDSCSINSVLFADFYESAGVVTGSGSATMMFKTDRRALMGGSASASGRSLQDTAAIAAATSEFDIAISVGVSDEDGVGALKTAGGASLLFGSTSALASIIVIVVGLVSVSADLMA